jgi:hypothetical protein
MQSSLKKLGRPRLLLDGISGTTNLFWCENLRAIQWERDRAMKCNNSISMCWRPYPVRTPFQGDSIGGSLPRAKALGCSLFALRAMAKRPNPTFPWANSGGVASNTPAGMTALQTMTNSNGLCNFSAPESPEVGCPGVFRLGVETLYI